MSNALLEGIKKWLNHIKAPNGYSIRLYLQSHNSHYTDASKLGFGGHSPLYIYTSRLHNAMVPPKSEILDNCWLGNLIKH